MCIGFNADIIIGCVECNVKSVVMSEASPQRLAQRGCGSWFFGHWKMGSIGLKSADLQSKLNNATRSPWATKYMHLSCVFRDKKKKI